MIVIKIVGLLLVFISCHASAQAVSSAYAISEKNLEVQMPQTQLLWGDTHVHTVLSGDSALFGNKLVGPDEAYRFAKGEVVQASLGKPAQLETPLDFLLVSDHAETMSAIWQLRHPTAEQKPPRNAPIRPLPSRNHLGTLLLGPCRAKAIPERSHSAPAVREAPGSAPARPLPSESLPNYSTRPDGPPQFASPAVFGSGKHYACRHFAIGGLGHPYKP